MIAAANTQLQLQYYTPGANNCGCLIGTPVNNCILTLFLTQLLA